MSVQFILMVISFLAALTYVGLKYTALFHLKKTVVPVVVVSALQILIRSIAKKLAEW